MRLLAWALLPLVLSNAATSAGAASAGESAATAVSEERVPPVRLVEEYRTIELQAATFEELRDQLRRDGLLMTTLGSHGLTASRIEVQYEFDAARRPCQIGRAEVSAHVVVTLPDWRPQRPPSNAQRQQWEHWLAALHRHEARHAADAVTAAGQLRTALLAQLPRPRCRDLDWDVQRQIDRALLKLQLKGERFDQATDHGRRDGVEL